MFLGCVDFIPGCCVTKKHYLLEDLSCPPLHHDRVCQGAGKIDVELHSSSFYCHNLAEAKTREGRKEELAGSNIQGLRVTEQRGRCMAEQKCRFPSKEIYKNFMSGLSIYLSSYLHVVIQSSCRIKSPFHGPSSCPPSEKNKTRGLWNSHILRRIQNLHASEMASFLNLAPF